MNTTSTSMDPTMKRWLGALSLATVASVALLAHSFFRTFSTNPEEIASVPQPAAPVDEQELHTISQPVWNDLRRSQRAAQKRVATPSTSPFGVSATEKREQTKAMAQDILQTQAEYLRNATAENRDTDGVNQLTPQQIDEMQKNGDAAW